MSYQAIARKWRPGTFEEIAGQGHVTRTLQNALRLGRIHHAFLFTGARGVGKTTAARTLARCLNCVNGPTPVPCGECPSCLEVPLGSSPDVTEIDGASNNSVEDVRELRDAVRYLPSRDKRRVYIIDEVHMLSIGAFNALLKTLEEPPPHVVFIFATTEPQKIPDTILSRVQRFDFKRIPESTVVGRLSLICESEEIKIPEAGLRLIARAGEGSMRDAQSLLDQVIAFGGDEVSTEQVADILGMVDRELLYEFLTGLVAGEPDRCLDVIAKVYDYGYELSQFTSEMLELLRNAALVVLSPRSRQHVDVPAEELERLSQLCEGMSADTFARYFQAMLAIHDEVSRTSRPRLVLEMAVARLASIRQLQPLDHLLSRMEDLERRLRGGGNAPRPGRVRPPRRPGAPGPATPRLRARRRQAPSGAEAKAARPEPSSPAARVTTSPSPESEVRLRCSGSPRCPSRSPQRPSSSPQRPSSSRPASSTPHLPRPRRSGSRAQPTRPTRPRRCPPPPPSASARPRCPSTPPCSTPSRRRRRRPRRLPCPRPPRTRSASRPSPSTSAASAACACSASPVTSSSCPGRGTPCAWPCRPSTSPAPAPSRTTPSSRRLRGCSSPGYNTSSSASAWRRPKASRSRRSAPSASPSTPPPSGRRSRPTPRCRSSSSSSTRRSWTSNPSRSRRTHEQPL
ncbi:MAG: DNA polymerase III subunit gamma/tau [Alphaproteobacteria bacterium]|nr:DNA polymerase III subunit gamma/tau [Alphaproteobacteria bacterium]